MPKTAIIPVFADQLSVNLSVLARADRLRDRVLMVEVAEEASQVAHHGKKLAFLFSAMRHHAEALRQSGWDVKERTGPDACPFNSLYWDFLARNREKLHRNPRLAQAYRTWERMPEQTRSACLDSAQGVLARLEKGCL